MQSLDHPLLSQAAVLLYTILPQAVPASCALEEMEAAVHRLAQEVARQAAERWVQEQVAQAESTAPECTCGQPMLAEQKCARAVLLLFGLVSWCWRRYRCPQCGSWRAPAAERLGLLPRQRMSRTLQEIISHYGLSWSYQAAAVLLARVLPGAAVSAKTVERVTKRTARRRQEQEDEEARSRLAPGAATAPSPGDGPPPFAQPERIFIGLDGILVRGRAAKERLEVQVGSLWSAWKELPHRQHPRRVITDRTLVARAEGWDKLGAQVWRVFCQRGGLRTPPAEVVVLGDGASGIRSLRELYFPCARGLLDPWHLWEKVKQRAKEVLGHRERGIGAAQGVYDRLRRGRWEEARELIELWPAASEWAERQRARLLAYLERNREEIADYEALRESGYMTGSGLTEKQNDLVVAPRMKNGKMHWSRAGANAVALLRAHVLNDPAAPLLPN